MAHARHHPQSPHHSRLEEEQIMATVGDVKKYLRGDLLHLLIMGLTPVPGTLQPYINLTTDLLHQIARDNEIQNNQFRELDDDLWLTPEADTFFSRLQEAVKIIADTL